MTELEQGRLGWLEERFRDQVFVQSYTPQILIEGVRLLELKLFADEGGDFCEISRLDEGGYLSCLPDYRPAQISYSLMEPGTIKAWHLHEHQDDVWFVPPGQRVLVGLHDVRADSATPLLTMRLALGIGAPRLLFIPRGVAHGVANLSTQPTMLVYFANQTFDSLDPDELRLPHDLLGIDFWSIHQA